MPSDAGAQSVEAECIYERNRKYQPSAKSRGKNQDDNQAVGCLVCQIGCVANHSDEEWRNHDVEPVVAGELRSVEENQEELSEPHRLDPFTWNPPASPGKVVLEALCSGPPNVRGERPPPAATAARERRVRMTARRGAENGGGGSLHRLVRLSKDSSLDNLRPARTHSQRRPAWPLLHKL